MEICSQSALDGLPNPVESRAKRRPRGRKTPRHGCASLVTIVLSNQHGVILGLPLTAGLVAENGTYFDNAVPEPPAQMLHKPEETGYFFKKSQCAQSVLMTGPPKKTHVTKLSVVKRKGP